MQRATEAKVILPLKELLKSEINFLADVKILINILETSKAFLQQVATDKKLDINIDALLGLVVTLDEKIILNDAYFSEQVKHEINKKLNSNMAAWKKNNAGKNSYNAQHDSQNRIKNNLGELIDTHIPTEGLEQSLVEFSSKLNGGYHTLLEPMLDPIALIGSKVLTLKKAIDFIDKNQQDSLHILFSDGAIGLLAQLSNIARYPLTRINTVMAKIIEMLSTTTSETELSLLNKA